MSEKILRKMRRFLVYVAFLLIAFGLAYMLVYTLDYKPLGYEGVKGNEDRVVLKSLDIMGLEEERITYIPQEGEEWMTELLSSRINQQQTYYLFFFTPLIAAVFWGAVDFYRRKSVTSVLIRSFLYVIFPALSLIDHLNHIKEMLNSP